MSKLNRTSRMFLKAVASLGDKTLTPSEVNKLLEGKLVGVLRSVAATMDLQELHEKRQEFSDQVQEACRDDLEQNGFKLESVAVTNLDQTRLRHLMRTTDLMLLPFKQSSKKLKIGRPKPLGLSTRTRCSVKRTDSKLNWRSNSVRKRRKLKP